MGFCVSSDTSLHHFNLCCFPPVPSSSARFYGILRAATLDGIAVTEASSSSGLRRSSNGVRLQPGAVSQTSHGHSQPALISLWLLWLPYIIITAPKTLFPHCFVACLFLPAVCLCIHFKQRECSPCAEGPDWNSAAEQVLSFSMEKALQTSLVVNARHMQEQHFQLLLHQASVQKSHFWRLSLILWSYIWNKTGFKSLPFAQWLQSPEHTLVCAEK